MTESKRIGDLFARYATRLRAPQKSVEQVMVVVVAEVLQITLKPHQVVYTPASRIIAIHAPSMLKSEIKAREAEILTRMELTLGAKSVPQVIL